MLNLLHFVIVVFCLFAQKFHEEKEKNAFLQKHYHEEFRKKDKIIENQGRLLKQHGHSPQSILEYQNIEIAPLQSVDGAEVFYLT